MGMFKIEIIATGALFLRKIEKRTETSNNGGTKF